MAEDLATPSPASRAGDDTEMTDLMMITLQAGHVLIVGDIKIEVYRASPSRLKVRVVAAGKPVVLLSHGRVVVGAQHHRYPPIAG